MVLVSTTDRRRIYELLLDQGVICFKKDTTGIHDFLKIPNLHCFLVLRSLNSRKFTSEIFSWQWHYYFLKPEGVKYLREYLGLPETVIPESHKFETQKKEEGDEAVEGETEEGESRPRRGGRGRGGRGRGRGPRTERPERTEAEAY